MLCCFSLHPTRRSPTWTQAAENNFSEKTTIWTFSLRMINGQNWLLSTWSLVAKTSKKSSPLKKRSSASFRNKIYQRPSQTNLSVCPSWHLNQRRGAPTSLPSAICFEEFSVYKTSRSSSKYSCKMKTMCSNWSSWPAKNCAIATENAACYNCVISLRYRNWRNWVRKTKCSLFSHQA